METPPVFAFIGVSGAGKTELVRWLCEILSEMGRKTGRIRSQTTRDPRTTDPVGEYNYISHDQFNDYIRRKCFAWYVDAFGNRYGTLSEDLEKAVDDSYQNETVYFLLIVPETVPAARQFIEGYGGSLICLYIECDDENELYRRLSGRESNPGVIERRIQESRDYKEKIQKMVEVYKIGEIYRIDNSRNDKMTWAKEQILKILKEKM